MRPSGVHAPVVGVTDTLIPVEGGADIQLYRTRGVLARQAIGAQAEILCAACSPIPFGIDARLQHPLAAGHGFEAEPSRGCAHVPEALEGSEERCFLRVGEDPGQRSSCLLAASGQFRGRLWAVFHGR